MTPIVIIFAVLIAAAGWHYAFHSLAGQRLAAIEQTTHNHRRVRMRRLGGILLLMMGVLLYLGIAAITPERNPRWFVLIWLTVLALLLLVIVLAMLDLRLTHRLRQHSSYRNRR